MKNTTKILLLLTLVAAVSIFATSVSYMKVESKIDVNEDISTGTIDMKLVHNQLNEVKSYKDGATKFDCDLVYADTVKVTQTVDLTSLTNTLGQSLNLTSQRVVAGKFLSRTTNTGTITIEPGASNGYDLFGASFKLILEPGQSFLFICDTMTDEVGASDKTLKFTCGSDTLDWLIVTADLN